MFVEKWKICPTAGSKVVGFILWGLWISAQNFKGNPSDTGLFQSGPKWWTDSAISKKKKKKATLLAYLKSNHYYILYKIILCKRLK